MFCCCCCLFGSRGLCSALFKKFVLPETRSKIWVLAHVSKTSILYSKSIVPGPLLVQLWPAPFSATQTIICFGNSIQYFGFDPCFKNVDSLFKKYSPGTIFGSIVARPLFGTPEYHAHMTTVLGIWNANNQQTRNHKPQTLKPKWEGGCCVLKKTGRPKADKASEASKPTVNKGGRGLGLRLVPCTLVLPQAYSQHHLTYKSINL